MNTYHKCREYLLILFTFIFFIAYAFFIVSFASCIKLTKSCSMANFFNGTCTFDCYFCSDKKESIVFQQADNKTYFYTCWWRCRQELENVTTECYLDNLYRPKNMYLPKYDDKDKKFYENCPNENQKFLCYFLPLILIIGIVSMLLTVLVYKNKVCTELINNGERTRLIIN